MKRSEYEILVRQTDTLTLRAKIVGMMLASYRHWNGSDEVWFNRERFAADCGQSWKSCRRGLEELQAAGLVADISLNKFSSRYRLTEPDKQASTETDRERATETDTQSDSPILEHIETDNEVRESDSHDGESDTQAENRTHRADVILKEILVTNIEQDIGAVEADASPVTTNNQEERAVDKTVVNSSRRTKLSSPLVGSIEPKAGPLKWQPPYPDGSQCKPSHNISEVRKRCMRCGIKEADLSLVGVGG